MKDKLLALLFLLLTVFFMWSGITIGFSVPVFNITFTAIGLFCGFIFLTYVDRILGNGRYGGDDDTPAS